MNYDCLILEIDEKADLTVELVKKAYKKLLKKYHPDLNKNDLEYTEKIIQINDAYQRLLKQLGKVSSIKRNQKIQSDNINKEGIIQYKDQAYAFYKQGFIHFDKITSLTDPISGLKLARAEATIKSNKITRQVEEDSEEIKELVSKQLFHSSRAIYYFSIVRNEYSESNWAFDAHSKIIHIKKYLEKNLTMIKKYFTQHSDRV